jgi:hypothetical protein
MLFERLPWAPLQERSRERSYMHSRCASAVVPAWGGGAAAAPGEWPAGWPAAAVASCSARGAVATAGRRPESKPWCTHSVSHTRTHTRTHTPVTDRLLATTCWPKPPSTLIAGRSGRRGQQHVRTCLLAEMRTVATPTHRVKGSTVKPLQPRPTSTRSVWHATQAVGADAALPTRGSLSGLHRRWR